MVVGVVWLGLLFRPTARGLQPHHVLVSPAVTVGALTGL